MRRHGERRENARQVGEGQRRPAAAGLAGFLSLETRRPPEPLGMVDRLAGDILHTVEFNTSDPQHRSESNGGAVTEKERRLSHVLGYIKTYADA